MIKELNKILEIETRLLTTFHLQTDGQTKQINQELEQYLRFFIDYRQRDWPEWLAIAEFAVNNKVYIVMKVSSFMANYGRELRMGVDIKKKEKVENTTKFVERMRKVQKEARTALKKAQENIKRQANKKRKERGQNNTEYKRFGIQEETDKKASGPIHGSICH